MATGKAGRTSPGPRHRADLVRLLDAAGRAGIVTSAAARRALRRSAASTADVLASFVRAGWLTRLRRGVYLIHPLDAAPSTTLRPAALAALAYTLFQPCYLGGWTAAERHGFMLRRKPHPTFVVSGGRVRQGHAVVHGVQFHVVKVAPDRVLSVLSQWGRKPQAPHASLERTIVDALIAPHWLTGLTRLSTILEEYSQGPDWRPDLLLRELREADSGAARKRLGYLLETLRIIERRRYEPPPDPSETPESRADREAIEDEDWLAEEDLTEELRRRITKGYIKLDPALKKRGRLDTRWGLWINVTLEPGPLPYP